MKTCKKGVHQYDEPLKRCFFCKKEQNKKYRAENADKRREYYVKNADKLREQRKKYYAENADKLREQRKKYYAENADKGREQRKKYYAENADKLREQEKKYRAENADKLREQKKKYRAENLDKRREYINKRYKTDRLFKLSHVLRARIRMALKAKNFKKSKKYREFIGCTDEELAKHLKSQFKLGMSWENHGFGIDKWNIDHIIPLASAKNEEDVYRLSHYTNLQPMWQPDNLKKSDKILIENVDKTEENLKSYEKSEDNCKNQQNTLKSVIE